MQAIGVACPPGDGLACFNSMYLEVTQAVGREIGQGFFADADFMTTLDVVFANLYFAAADAAGEPGGEPGGEPPSEPEGEAATVPLAWRPLVERRAARSIEPIQFALAGMNAHINHDLPVAVVAACTQLGTAPAEHAADFQKVDQLLDAAEESIRRSFENTPELAVDRHLQAVCNLIANWSINSARDLAWKNALVLWALRGDAAASGIFAGGLAAAAALSSDLLLSAV
jgi:hypothetical protein